MSIRSKTSGFVRSVLRSTGRDIVAHDAQHLFPLQEAKLMAAHKISLILDVGANSGQTGLEFRENGFAGKIISFEPLAKPFAELSGHATGDAKWKVIQAGLGERAERMKINVSGTDCSSSFLSMDDRHVSMVAESAYVGDEEVRVETLDGLAPELLAADDKIYLKIDTQGYELFVLKGAAATLRRIDLVKIEVSGTQLYKGPKYHETMKFMDESGFDFVGIQPAFYEKSTGYFLQYDALFARRGALGH